MRLSGLCSRPLTYKGSLAGPSLQALRLLEGAEAQSTTLLLSSFSLRRSVIQQCFVSPFIRNPASRLFDTMFHPFRRVADNQLGTA